ncbi:MAG: LysM peptidoglycan-binding domain-containing protein [Candidatus Electryoneaceae bacterium]|nr:LysM peptidoglycan-binding domain-containing protein [Candidatus Electryoneaceae bacterium]
MMTFHKQIVPIVLLSVVIMLLIGGTATAQERLKYDDYIIKLESARISEAAVLAKIEALERVKAIYRVEMEAVNAEITATWDEIFVTADLTRQEYKEFMMILESLEGKANELLGCRPEQLLERVTEFDALIAQVNEISAHSGIYLTEALEKYRKLAARLQGIKNRIPEPSNDTYNVLRGDFLWKIAGRQHVYGNSFKWHRIWSANRTEISNPDLIYPNQRLRIPQQIGRNQHLVARGEFLSKIAGYSDVYGNPFLWTRIYQANKSGEYLQDPNMIYPEQILDIPR